MRKNYYKYSMEELLEMQQKIQDNPKNQKKGGFYLYTREARKKLDDIAWAITAKIRENKNRRKVS